ncbi:endonuclease/exonuclease/phosphatase family protein [Nocardioides pacificus]
MTPQLGARAAVALLGGALALTGLSPVTAAAVTTTTAPVAESRPAQPARPMLKVMSQNLYLGSSLNPALAATTQAEFVGAVATIYGTAVATDFPTRAGVIADTVAARKPDLIGLQEVTRWLAQPLTAEATPPSYDFLKILRQELRERGMSYRVASVSENADIGPAPLVAPAFGCRAPQSAEWAPDCLVKLQDRDVILERVATPRLKITRAVSGRYQAQEVLAPPGGAPVSFARGWTYVDGKHHGVPFRFVNTHLEVEGFAATQEAQAREFLAGPARTRGIVIAVGDFNSAADPATTDQPTATYGALTSRWFQDAWSVNPGRPGLTCCQSSALTNLDSRLRTRIDLVLTHGRVKVKSARTVGTRPFTTEGSGPYWASDHAGVVARLRLNPEARG